MSAIGTGSTALSSETATPLELFLREQVETVGGVWDEVEPQVYDLLLPPDMAGERSSSVVRVAFDPEALAEHPQAQLASLGTPIIDALLTGAVTRGRFTESYLVGLNLRPHHLAEKAVRAVKLAEGLSLHVQRIRPLAFPQWVLWFEATVVSDQQEQEIIPIAVDLHTGRQVRHMEMLLNESRLTDSPPEFFPEASSIPRAEAYHIAREQVLRTVASLINARARELEERLARQVGRMSAYYDDLGQELEEQAARTAARGTDAAKVQSRREALIHEREMRIAELRRKSALKARLKLLQALVVRQPKLQLHAEVRERASRLPAAPLSMSIVWDPLMETIEAVTCANCRHSTFELARIQNQLVCFACADRTMPGQTRLVRQLAAK